MICDLKRSVDIRWLFDPVLHSSLADLVRTTLNKSAYHKKKVLSGLTDFQVAERSSFFVPSPKTKSYQMRLPTCGREAAWPKTRFSPKLMANKHETVTIHQKEVEGWRPPKWKTCARRLLNCAIDNVWRKKVIAACYKGHSQCHPSWSDKKLLGATCAPH